MRMRHEKKDFTQMYESKKVYVVQMLGSLNNAYPRTSTTILYLIQILRFLKPQKKSQNSNEVKNGCTWSRVRIVPEVRLYIEIV